MHSLKRGWGLRVRSPLRGLSGHGFSPKERRAKAEWELIFLAGKNQRATNPQPSPRHGKRDAYKFRHSIEKISKLL
jgi:hypothetical protein